jgi:uncharacterized protein YndB with AHSA1/START domain
MTDRIEKKVLLRASVARVWRALTDHEEFGAWFRVALESPFVPGKATRGKLLYPGTEHLTMEATVVEMMEPRVFSFRWHPYAIDPSVDYSSEPTTLVEFRLEEGEGGTWLTVVESGFDHVPSKRRAEALRMNDAGWSIQLENVAKHVAG